jgi:hypothetical protein
MQGTTRLQVPWNDSSRLLLGGIGAEYGAGTGD